MAAVPTHLTDDASTSNPASTASISPGADRLILLAVSVTKTGSPAPTAGSVSVAGLGLTWVLVGSQDYRARRRIYLFRAMGSPTTGVVTITYGGAATFQEMSWSVSDWSGVDTSGADGENAVASLAVNQVGTGSTSLTVTIVGSPSAGDATYGAFAVEQSGGPPTVEAGWDTLSTRESANVRHLIAVWDVDQDLTPSVSWGSSSNGAGGLAVIVVAESGLPVDAASHGHTADQPTLTQVHEIAVDSASHGHTAEAATVSGAGGGVPTGAYARYLASDLSGTHSNGDPVASWPDASGNGRDAVQATLADQPFYRDTTTDLAAHPCVDFLNVDTRRLLSATFGSALPTTTWAAVFSFPSLFTSNRVWLDGDTGRHAVFYDPSQQYTLFAGSVVTSATVATTGVHTLIAVFNGASSALYVDGVEVVTGNVGAQSLDRVVLGAESDGGNQTDIEMVEVLLYDRALDATERSDLLAYFDTTYLGGATPVAAAEASHGHTADEPALTQVHTLSVDSASHGHSADQVTIAAGGDVDPDDATHGHTVDQPALTQVHALAPVDASHGHSASEVSLADVQVFSGGILPDGWTAVQPANTAVTLAGLYLELGIDPSQSIDSLSSGTASPEGPLVWRPVTGEFDFAVALAEEAWNLPNQGLDLLALDDDMVGGVRLGGFCGNQSSSYRNDIGWFVWGSNAGTVLNTTGSVPMGGLYGGPGWLRLAYDGAGTFTCYASHTGLSGTWSQLAQFSDAFAPTRFAIHANASNSGTNGRVQRINRVVDLQARGTDDATNPPTVDTRTTLYTEDFSGGSLPAWLTPVTANNGSVSTTTAGVELAIDEATLQSQAWLLTPDDLPPSHGLLLRYQLTSAGFVNSFWVPAVAVETTTDIAGAETPDDKWGDGTSLLMEMPAREHAADGQLLRMLRRSPIRQGETQTGSREFDGYTLMTEDPSAPVSTVGRPLTWIRIERVGHWLQVKLWADGDPEPGTWTYQAQDHMRNGLGAAITLSQNDGVSGSNTASVRFDRITIYEAVSGTDLTTNDPSHGHTADQATITQGHLLTADDARHGQVADEPALTQTHELVVDNATHSHAADQPTLTQAHALAADDANHSHTAAEVMLTAGQVVTPDNAIHGHTAASPTLAQQHLLTVDPAVHAHTAAEVALTQLHQLAAADASHGHTADEVTFPPTVVPATSLTPGSTRPALIPGSTRPLLTPGGDRVL